MIADVFFIIMIEPFKALQVPSASWVHQLPSWIQVAAGWATVSRDDGTGRNDRRVRTHVAKWGGLFGDGSYLVRSENKRQAKAGTGREARRLGEAYQRHQFCHDSEIKRTTVLYHTMSEATQHDILCVLSCIVHCQVCHKALALGKAEVKGRTARRSWVRRILWFPARFF